MSQPSSASVRTDSTNLNFGMNSVAPGEEQDEMSSMDCSRNDITFVNEPYTLWQLTAEDVKAKRLCIEHFSRRLVLDDSVNDMGLHDLHHSKQMQIATDKDGACGWHAVFGMPDLKRELHGVDARKRMAELLPVDFDELASKFEDGHAAFRGLRTSLWSEFAVPYYRHKLDPKSNPLEFNEQHYFRVTFDEPDYDQIREEGMDHHSKNESTAKDKVQARNMLESESRKLFHSDFEPVWTRFGVTASLLPAVKFDYLQPCGYLPFHRFDLFTNPNFFLRSIDDLNNRCYR